MLLVFVWASEETHELATTSGRMMGIDSGNPSTDFEAGMWLMALVATLAAAVPVAFLSPNLGRKRRQASDEQAMALAQFL